MIRDEDRKYLEEEFTKHLKDNVDLVVFTSEDEKCQFCNETKSLAEELSTINDKINLKVYEFEKDKEVVEKYNVTKYPATVVAKSGETDGRIVYYGIPSGYEFGSLIEDLKNVSRNEAEISSKAMEIVSKIDKPVKIQVFVTPTCPYCPKAVGIAHKFALLNKNITGEMIEAQEFPTESDEAGVSAVPHIVINGDVNFVGAQPDEVFAEYLLEAYNN